MILASTKSNSLAITNVFHCYLSVLGVFLWCTLMHACPIGYYGNKCKSECSMNCLSMECDNKTGACTGGCKDGYIGDMCDEECDSGFYGNNCTLKCPSDCADGVCDHMTGNCKNGCLSGYQGIRCEISCSKGYYGEGCKTKCPVNCADNICHPEDGRCVKGCDKNFWGVDCSLVGEFRQNSEPAKQKFYKNLSAESRSVLLYILMGQYEATLEHAQMEIRKGIRQRNELRELIGADL